MATLGLIALIGYGNTFRVPFVFDDRPSIVENPTVHRLATALTPPAGGLPVSGRPIVNLSLAVNLAFGGMNPAGYHAANLLFHAAAALVLFGLVRITLARGGRANATTVALAVAAIWAAHPLLTEAVTYTVQRAEVLVALFLLLTLYAFARATASRHPGRWLGLSIAACALGMATKEVMAAAPLLVLVYDRTFVSGALAEAWRRRRGYYLGLAATWAILAGLVGGGSARGGTAGFGLNITPFAYALTQCEAIVRYVGLALWPQWLAFDYNTYLATPGTAVLFVIVIAAAGAFTFAAWKRWPGAAFLAVAFWAILAPSSSVVPVATQTIAEHRTYLPLAALISAAVVGLEPILARRLQWAAFAGIAALLALTAARNHAYRSELALWNDTVAKRPENVRARYNLALAALDAGDAARAIAESEAAIRLAPESADAHHNFALILLRTNRAAEALEHSQLAVKYRPWMADAEATVGVALLRLGRAADAVEHFRTALRLNPNLFEAHHNLGSALLRLGQPADALPEVQAALALRPDHANAHNTLAETYRQLGRAADALTAVQHALGLDPNFAEAYYTRGNLLLQNRQPHAAAAAFETALRLNPGLETARLALAGARLQEGRTQDALQIYTQAAQGTDASYDAHYHFANALFQLNRFADAAREYEAALKLDPKAYSAHYNLGHAWLAQEKPLEAIPHLRAATALNPASVDAHFTLGETLLAIDRPAEAVTAFETAVRLAPNSAEAHTSLGDALAELGRKAEAAAHYETALRLDPTSADAKQRLAALRATSR